MNQEIGTDRVTLTDEIMRSLKCSRIFKDANKNINSFDFSKDGKWLAAGTDEGSVILYDVEAGTYFWRNCSRSSVFFNKKYGVSHVTYTHSHKSILCASKNGERILMPST